MHGREKLWCVGAVGYSYRAADLDAVADRRERPPWHAREQWGDVNACRRDVHYPEDGRALTAATNNPK
ncbi:hypothetical protein PAMC26577_30990 [Caballeronia sordidicola]|uniref:Uncharacterized protein n=1 Tax=Caballeronia sordidicola TaxID=196367 RepID=A0A242ME99_CABSO|nr:hypothetical protein PAMC26577_30990 [Caballeronia sordidicola]